MSNRDEQVQKYREEQLEKGLLIKDGKFRKMYLEEGALAYYQGFGCGITFMAAGSIFGMILTDVGPELHISRMDVNSDEFYIVRPILGKIKSDEAATYSGDSDDWLKRSPDPRNYPSKGIDFKAVETTVAIGDTESAVHFYLGAPITEGVFYEKREVVVNEGEFAYEKFEDVLYTFIREETIRRSKPSKETLLLNAIFGDKSGFRYTDKTGLVYDTTRCELLGEGYFSEGYIFFYRKRTGKFFSIMQPRLMGAKKLKVHTDEGADKVAALMLEQDYMKQDVYDKYFGPDANKRVPLNTTISKSLRDKVSASRKTIAQLLELGLRADNAAVGRDFIVADRDAHKGDVAHDEVERLVENVTDAEFDGVLDSEDLATIIAMAEDWGIFSDMIPNETDAEYQTWEDKFKSVQIARAFTE